MSTILFIIFAGMAIGCALAMVSQTNPLYSAISLIGVFISLASIYVTLAAPFIAAVQVIVYAGAIMVLVIFVIMLLNVEHSEPRRRRLKFLVPLSIAMAGVLLAETAFILYSVQTTENHLAGSLSNVGLTHSIGEGLFTRYLLPFEVTSVLLLMAIVGAMSLARRANILSPGARVVPGAQVLAMDIVNPAAVGDLRPVETGTTEEAAHLLGVTIEHRLPRRHAEREDLRAGTDRPDHVARLSGRRVAVGRGARELGAAPVDLAGPLGQIELGEHDLVCAEGIGLDAVGADGEVLGMHLLDEIGAGDVEDLRAVFTAEEILLYIPILRLDPGADAAVREEDAGAQAIEKACGHERVYSLFQ